METSNTQVDIPSFVKIAGRVQHVYASARGYVRVGQSEAQIPPERIEEIRAAGTPSSVWLHEMYKCFERALAAERQRLKASAR